MPAPDPSVPPGLVVAWFGLVGAVIGSFLNVVIARVPAGESIVRPGSRCPGCRAPIAWFDNVPIVSWVLLRARCRRCGARISARYPLVEALGAVAGVLACTRHGFTVAAFAELALVALALALAFIDLDTWLLPHALTWPLLLVGLAASGAGLTPADGLRDAALGGAVGFGAFALVSLGGRIVFRREALGFGDVWLLAGLGAWLGIRALLPVVLLASLQGSVVGLALLALGKGQPGPVERPSDEEPVPAEPSAVGAGDEPARSGGEASSGEEVTSGAPPATDAGAPQAAAPQATDEDWVPPRHAVPFGPFLVAGALEWLYLAPALARTFPALAPFV